MEKLSDHKIHKSWLQDRWSLIQASLADEEERVFCEASGALGIDPYLCDEGEAQAIEQAGEYFDDEALLEFFASQHGRKPRMRCTGLQQRRRNSATKLPYPSSQTSPGI